MLRKHIRQLFALILAFVMIVAASSVAFAKGKTEQEDNILWLNKNTYLLSEDLPDGSCKFTTVQDGVIIDVVTTSPQTIQDEPTRASYTDLGSIKYTYKNSTGTHTCAAEVYLKTTKVNGTQYNINGKYKNMAAVASLLAGVFSLPSAVATSIAKGILDALSIALGATSILIPDCFVTVNKQTNNWKFVNKNNTSHLNTISATKYTVTQKGKYSGKVYYDHKSLYHEKSEFTNKTKSFASVVYSWLFSNYAAYSKYTYTVK